MVIESEVLNDFPIFIGVFITEFAVCGAVNLAVKMKGDMIIKNLNLEPVINAMDVILEFCSPSWWKELSKEMSSKILPCGDGSCWRTFKPIASLIEEGKLK
ncbi:hypothetical protein Tco_0382272 [Tanacetum coccineum]